MTAVATLFGDEGPSSVFTGWEAASLYLSLPGDSRRIDQDVSHELPEHCGARWGYTTAEGTKQRSAVGFCLPIS